MNMNAPPAVVYPSPGVQVQGQHTQIVIVQVPASPLEMSDAKRRSFVGLGATQLILGILSIICNIGAMVSLSSVTLYVAPGIWRGILFILAGSFGIGGGKRKSKAMVVTCLVLSIISAIASVVILSVSIVINQDPYAFRYSDGDQRGAIACDAILVVGELVIAIVLSAICCGALCGRQQPTSIHYVNSSTGQTYAAQPGAVVLQPECGAVPQVAYPSQCHQGPASHGSPQALPGGY